MTRSLAILGLSIATLLLSAAVASAQQCTACVTTNTVSVHVGKVLRLGVQGSTPVVRSNGAWRLAVTTAQPTSTPAGGSPGTYALTVRLTLVGA